ncbi:hypothetical protein BCR39DRAFT_516853 [Naematelia encephala]|uniref:tRNA-splicing endonuclease subunit Sen54 N-terminal domain-containing protein n=1 Tax=Naematelia encephala TaxID=71784 RepID=A0A1Y2BHF7_9TREE|nr:hypothetical protein BCR39DRAFT_516853 [Naematelia encephala]
MSSSQEAGPSSPRHAAIGSTIYGHSLDTDHSPMRDIQSSLASNARSMVQPILGDEESDEDEEHMDLKTIQAFAEKVQHLPIGPEAAGSARSKIVIPRRGEKDFEPLKDTINLQEMMLQRSREALFGALVGVRGGNSKSISHAVLVPASPFPRVIVTRGHLLDTLGIIVRSPPVSSGKGKVQTFNELLPEEALYMLERGSLQIWVGAELGLTDKLDADVKAWSDEEYGVKGAVEMSVMEGYGAFIGKEGLTWERYQAYAYLKRLGYTVQRSRQFIPAHFLKPGDAGLGTRNHASLPPFRSWWFSLPNWISTIVKFAWRACRSVTIGALHVMKGMVSTIGDLRRNNDMSQSSFRDYRSLFMSLRVIPTLHTAPLPSRPRAPISPSIYDDLIRNPYLPFFHVWKPAAPWSKVKWDKGSSAGLLRHRPDYFVAVVDARKVPLPNLHELAEVFDRLPEEPKGPTRKVGPQYSHGPVKAPSIGTSVADHRLFGWLSLARRETLPVSRSNNNPIASLRNGDRGFIVAVNDSGNTGWIRFGRAGFGEYAML